MGDVHDPETRSYNMSRIKGKDTKPEMIVRRYLFSQGFRYRLHYKRLPGKPDIVLPKYRTVIFVHGCFWHGHEGCKYFVLPKTRREWWRKKIETTKEKDDNNSCAIRNQNWKIITVYECELKKDKREKKLQEICEKIK